MINRPSTRTLALVSLVVMAALWGSTFFSIKALVTRVPVPDMLAERFTIAAVVLGVVGWRHWAMSRRDWVHGVVLGLLFGFAQLLQTFGIAATSASNSGFVTGLYVVFTPILAALIFRDRISGSGWIAVVLAAVGLGVLSIDVSAGFRVGSGELLVLASAVLYAGHIVAASHFSTSENAISLSLVQTVVVAVVCWFAAVPDGVQWPTNVVDWAWLGYLAILCGALTIFLQIWAQAHVEPTRAAVIMATEPLFAAAFAVTLGGEALTLRMGVGGAIVFTATVLIILRGDQEKPTSDSA